MPRYLLSAYSVAGAPRPSMSEEEMRQAFAGVQRLEDEMRSAGAWVFGGRLEAPDTATVVRMAKGEMITTDGPFAESKEHLGGFYIIEATDLDAALAWASKVTVAAHTPIEVRPFFATSWEEATAAARQTGA